MALRFRFDDCLQNDADVNVVVISSSEGESSPAKFPKRTTDSDDAVSVHAGVRGVNDSPAWVTPRVE